MDMSNTIIAKSDQLNSDDLIGKDSIVIKITDIKIGGTPEQPVSIFYEGDNNKPYKPCKSMRRVLVHCWGNDSQNYIGRSLRLFREEKVKFAGADVGGIRISQMSNIKETITIALTTAKAKRSPYKINPLEESLKDLGLSAAKKGLAEYTAWGQKLSAEQKTSLGAEFIKEMTIVAKNFDAKGN